MNQIEERLAEEVRKHEHLYNPYRTDKDPQTAYNSWKVISASVGLEVLDCSTLWRKMRDRFVRQNKAMTGSGDSKATAFYIFLSWLEPHIRHRETSSKYDKPSPCNVATKKGPSLSTPATPEASPETSTSSPEASVQPSTPATPEASPETSTSSPEASVQPPTQTHEASPETSTSVSPLPSVPALSTPPAAMRLASPLSRRGRKKRQRAQRGKHDRQRWQRGQRGQYDRQRGQDDGQRRQDDRQMIRLDGQRRQDDGQRGQRGQDDGQMIRLNGQRRQDDGQMIRQEERRLDGQKKKMVVRDEYSRFGELVAAMMSRVQEDKRTEAMHSVYSLLN